MISNAGLDAKGILVKVFDALGMAEPKALSGDKR
jgi:hypothetical protein